MTTAYNHEFWLGLWKLINDAPLEHMKAMGEDLADVMMGAPCQLYDAGMTALMYRIAEAEVEKSE